MLHNLLLVALRSLQRNRGFALLNVVGLALGLACVILIALYIQDERGVDAFHERADRIVRIDVDFVDDGEVDPQGGSTQGVLAPAMAAAMPDVEAAVRLMGADPVLRVGNETFQVDHVLRADPEIFDVFTFPLLEGNEETALVEPGSIVLTETLAATLFGDAPAIGETVRSGGNVLTVTGIATDVPRQSHFSFDALISMSSVQDPGWYFDNWFAVGFATYVLLTEETTVDAFQAKLPAFIEAAAGDQMQEEGTDLRLHARPLPTLYLTAAVGLGTFGSAVTLQILALVALFVLLVAAVNFTNLATARSLDRSREVGVRKTLGAGRLGLAGQFLMEAVLLSGIALAVAVGLASLSLPLFRELSGKPLSLPDLGLAWLGLVGLAAATGLLAGAYPAVVLSGFRPADVLKGRFASGPQGQALRQGLVVVQFGISVALIAATVVVFNQLRYMQTQDLGIDLNGNQTQLLILPFNGDTTVVAMLPEIQSRLLALPGVTGTTASIAAPTFGNPSAGGFIEGPAGAEEELSVTMYIADTSYAGVYGVQLLAGRTLEAIAPDEAREYVLNESAVQKAGYTTPEAALGKAAQFWGMDGTVVGVVRDFHVDGLQRPIEPLALASEAGLESFLSILTVRVRTDQLPETLASAETLWGAVAPARPFRYSFLDEDFAEQYVAEQRFGRLFALFSGLAIAIACLGLFGLAAHAAASRTKEIGVRRVLGATVAQVVVLLTRNVVGLVAAGIAIAVPVVIVGMSRWLDGFAYRIDLGWVPLVVAGSIVFLIAVLTVGGHAFRAAHEDPVRALRSE